jgi:hypothetical protein
VSNCRRNIRCDEAATWPSPEGCLSGVIDGSASFQRAFGQSTRVRGAGMFVASGATSSRLPANELIECTHSHDLSVPVLPRGWDVYQEAAEPAYHQFPDGTRVRGDVYFAFLARFVVSQVVKTRPGAGLLLQAA